MPTPKYRDDVACDPAGRRLFWTPGSVEGFPLRGNVPAAVRQEEYEDLQLEYDARVAILTLPKDVDRYEEIIDRCANGWYVLRREKDLHYDEKTGDLKIFLAWLEVYAVPPRPNPRGKP